MKKKMNKLGVKELVLTILVLTVVLSTATYAWLSHSKTPRVSNLSILAGGSGILQIADDTGAGPSEYGEKLDLSEAIGAGEMGTMVLNPVTTKDGTMFYAPVYTGNTVVNVKALTDETLLHTSYVYEKTFYLKAEQNPYADEESIIKTEGKLYDIFLIGPAISTEHKGTHVYQSPDAEGSNVPGDTAVNALRVSFELENGTVFIYEPNSNISNQDNNRAEDRVKNDYGNYKTVKQYKDGKFVDSNNGDDSPILFTIEEGVDVKVTMRVWIEGTDLDCTDSIALDKITAMFEFMSKDVNATTYVDVDEDENENE